MVPIQVPLGVTGISMSCKLVVLLAMTGNVGSTKLFLFHQGPSSCRSLMGRGHDPINSLKQK